MFAIWDTSLNTWTHDPQWPAGREVTRLYPDFASAQRKIMEWRKSTRQGHGWYGPGRPKFSQDRFKICEIELTIQNIQDPEVKDLPPLKRR